MNPVSAGLLIGTAVVGGLQARQQYVAGKQAQIEYKEAAQRELDSARDREIERRRRLVSALASQAAEGGAIGAVPGIGSRAAITLRQAKEASYDTLADRATSGRRALMLRQAGNQAKKQGLLGAGATLLQTGVSVADQWPG